MLGISQPTVQGILKKDLRLRCFKKRRATELMEANKVARLRRARQLQRKYPTSLVNFIVFTDEKCSRLLARQTLRTTEYKRVMARVRRKWQLRECCVRARHSVVLSWSRSALGRTSIHFVEPGVKVNGQYYRDTLLLGCLLPEIRELFEYFIFSARQCAGASGSWDSRVTESKRHQTSFRQHSGHRTVRT